MKKSILSGFFISLMILFPVIAGAESLSHPNSAESAKLSEASCADGFSFVVMADTHVDQTIFPVMRDGAATMHPDFFVSVGDSTNNGLEDEYATFLGMIGKVKTPWFVAPGNHEYRQDKGGPSQEKMKLFKKIFGKSDFAFTHCGWKFIIVDIVKMDSLLSDQLRWIERELKGYEGRAAVFMHYPPAVLEKWKEGYWVMNGKEFLKLLESDRVPYFFSGHLHEYDHLRLGPTEYIVTGGGGGGFDADAATDPLYAPDGGPFHHFIYVTVNGDKTSYFVVRPGGE